MMITPILNAAALVNWLPSLLAQAVTGYAPHAAWIPPSGIDYIRVMPELVLSIFGMIVMVVDPLLDPDSSHESLGTIALVGTIAALASTFWMARYPGTAFWNMVRVEGFSVFFHVLVIAISLVAILSSFELHLKITKILCRLEFRIALGHNHQP